MSGLDPEYPVADGQAMHRIERINTVESWSETPKAARIHALWYRPDGGDKQDVSYRDLHIGDVFQAIGPGHVVLNPGTYLPDENCYAIVRSLPSKNDRGTGWGFVCDVIEGNPADLFRAPAAPPAPEPLPVLDLDGFFTASLEAQTSYFEDVMKATAAPASMLELRKFMALRMEQLRDEQLAAAEKYLRLGPKP